MVENKSALVTGLVYGIGALILTVLITFIVVSTMQDAELLRGTATTSTTVNETGRVNGTGYTLANFVSTGRSYAIVSIFNGTTKLTSANWTFTSTTGYLINASAGSYNYVNITYTYILDTNYEKTADDLALNLTKGVNNVSEKIPTILLIGAVVLLFGIIVLLVRQSQAMGIGNSNQGSL